MPFPSPMHESESQNEVTQSCPTLAIPWIAAYQASPSMGFSRQEYWSGVHAAAPAAAAAAKSLQLCPTLCAPPSLGFSKARTLEWVAISFTNA